MITPCDATETRTYITCSSAFPCQDNEDNVGDADTVDKIKNDLHEISKEHRERTDEYDKKYEEHSKTSQVWKQFFFSFILPPTPVFEVRDPLCSEFC